MVSSLGFVGHIISISNTQLCHCNMKAVIGNEYTIKEACLYFNKILFTKTNSGIIREPQVKTTMRSHFIPVRMTTIKDKKK